MSVDKEKLLKELRRLKEVIWDLKNEGIIEQETKDILINPLFEKLGWKVDRKTLRSEYPIEDSGEKVDYAFFRRGDTQKPLLLVEAKALGNNLRGIKDIKQICNYMITEGVQWGILTNGNKYIMYNSDAGHSYKEWNFLTPQIDDDSIEKLADDLIKFIGRDSLKNDGRQKFYQELVIDKHIENVFKSFTKSLDKIAIAIKKECGKTDPNLRINTPQIISYLKKLKDNTGKISFTINEGASSSDNIRPQQEGVEAKVEGTRKNKRETIPDLFNEGVIKAGEIWHFNYKGEKTTGIITDDGQLEVRGKTYDHPSPAGTAITNNACWGWDKWKYDDEQGKPQPISVLRERYRKRHNSKTVR